MAANRSKGTLQLWANVARPGLLGAHPGSNQPPRPQAFMEQTASSTPTLGFQGGYTPVPGLHGGSSYGSHLYGDTPPGFDAPSVPPSFGVASAPLGFGVPGH
jgi:hypothetical protein